MKKQDKLLRAKKFDYILDEYLSATEVQYIFGYDSPNMMYKLRRADSQLTEPHIKLLEYICKIPSKVFDKNIHFDKDNTSEIDNIIKENYKKIQAQSPTIKVDSRPFYNNPQLFNSLIGKWYGYFYASTDNRGIYCIETTIQEDGTVLDKNGNSGRLFIGKKQCMIVKESKNSQNFISITFENTLIAFNLFYFSMLSKQNVINQEMLSFGFFSKKELSLETAKEILGKKEKQQLKIDSEFTHQISEYVQILRK